ncbi:MAG: peptide-methionine (S)-S-oxide reductase MsrA [Planctomycetaceae bacterium]|jgi:peptide-methionine (S)-S-oxide reductase|nr:peptide-methionine (S)-S-oxide reductase MsrA [Planctomycetaceae bacterium]MBT4725519.1 peptide-methionine (S)-S-oxide reductase MsrA [Planctomycetaceae bacterium]MBT4843852.1 peptide-methionine (S)-S-oxide reductase MsrA [Planctomycetaceae bacterium]MBT5125521.1 peptide-methionine (S)-S-oxide reductase MsrA [Planctomycetaceae bacterium]MBT5885274.1 peptide-methionine (S)-S-oxide reductase MsrA [Planctomycetaceae bacterium]
MAEIAVLGAGCFWCVEAVFTQLKGVHAIRPGYCNGIGEDPTYEQVCTGKTGHAEVIEIEFEPLTLAYNQLLEVFFHSHDPTTLNQQGDDLGTQYRSGIYFRDAQQEAVAIQVRNSAAQSKLWPSPIVTEIAPLVTFYAAEAYHHDYYAHNPAQPYCSTVIGPKLAKLRKTHSHLLKV